ncbi:GHKL domain-containing protein [Enterococcus hulanensis]|uniref:sensor histidine kinase n=1 Tax=Enterococcus hulanensis TaxID=2559929 RepID=UPI00288C8910|nr:GHKL domain-containing protein [Enterococcus hulanensis]MDT2662486.1 GHKL domain-containing protein [Enterococcus hulanensis]
MRHFFIIYFSYSQIVVVTLCFFIFERLYKQKWYRLLVFIIPVIISVIIGTSYSTLDLLVLFLLLFIFFHKLFPEKNPMQPIFSIMCSAIIEIVTTPIFGKIMSYYFSVGNEIKKNIYSFIAILLLGGACIVTTFLIREKLYPYLIRIKKFDTVSLILLVLVLSYQTVEMSKDHKGNQNLFLLLPIFYLIIGTLVAFVLRYLTKNVLLEAEAKNNRIIADLQKNYVDEVKRQYQEIRKFRHDYTNLLTTVNFYLEQNKIEELKAFFSKDLMETTAVLRENNLILDSLQNIESLSIRSIFYTKLLSAQEKNIFLNVEITEPIPDFKTVGNVSLVRLFGIFLDNAIEELELLKKGSLVVVIFKELNEVTFIIQNTTREGIEPLPLLKKEGFSTRGKDRGIGLSNVEEILKQEPHVWLETSISEDLFIQKITILNEVKENDSSLYL